MREGTLREYDTALRQFIEVVGNMDLNKVSHEHRERFIRACLSWGNRPATIKKKINSLKSLFKHAVKQGQLDENPFQHVRLPKIPKREIHVFSEQECIRMIKAARESRIGAPFRWDLFILTALCTGMRRGELLNTTWQDIDFDKKIIHIRPKDDTKLTWKWQIKDTDTRHIKLHSMIMAIIKFFESLTPFTPSSARN